MPATRSKPKMLILDIESEPMLAAVFQLKQTYIAPGAIVEDPFTACFAYRWLGEKQTHFVSCYNRPNRKIGPLGAPPERRKFVEMIHTARRLLTEADGVIHYNGARFDIPMLHKEMVELKMTPPAPSVEHDLLKTVRSKFRFPSNTLNYVCQRLGIGKKHPHKGLDLWLECRLGNPTAWRVMRQYNINDIALTEKLYLRLLPWIDRHIDMGLWITDGRRVCPKCQNDKLLKYGYLPIRGGGGVYLRWRCQKCGAWPRERVQSTPEHRKGKGLA